MDITLTILYLHPTLTDDDFMVLNDNQWGWDYINWITEDPTEPTQQELDDAWVIVQAQQVKDADIEAFKVSDDIVTKLKAKKAELEDIYFNDSCSAENKVLILDVTTDLQTEIDTEETTRAWLMAQWVTDHWAGISNDYATAMINKIRWWNI